MPEKKPFQAESKRLLDLMIHSIYTHKEIFLRELISNASDAIDKYYLYALEHGTTPENLKIRIDLDEEKRTLTISDTGIGLDEKEMEENLGIIANSGSLAFKKRLEESQQNKEEIDLIGQFGVGFYSAFMVADKVEVLSKRVDSDKAWLWSSEGEDGYTIEPAVREEHGSTVTLYLKKDDDLESYSHYLDSNEITALVKRYSDYIRYPIELSREVQQIVEGTEKDEVPQFESVMKAETINSMIPLWKRAKNEIKDEEFEQFYHEHFYDFAKPIKTIFFTVEGTVSFTALLYIPGAVPMNFYTREYQPGLELYSKGVFIEGNCQELLPDYLRFVKGLVDSQDLSLNISREMLQHDHQLRVIRNRIEKKVLSELELMLKNNRENYEEFWKNFGLDIKLGVYNDFGINADKLKNLLLFYSSSTKSLVTLKTVVEKMPDDQKEIYYVSGSDIASLSKLPIVKSLVDKGFEVLYLTEDVDEFVLQTLGKYEDHAFKNVLSAELDVASEEEKKALQQQSEDNKDLLDYMKECLPEVSEVRLSNHFKDDAAMLVAGSGLSFEMERVLETVNAQSASMPQPKAERILEINPDNPIWNVLRAEYSVNKEKVKELSEILYAQACLIEGFKLSDPVTYSRVIVSLLTQDAKLSQEEK